MSADSVRIGVEQHVATVTLNRPDRHNALDLPMFEAVLAAAERLRAEPGVRAVVLHGAGPSFCSGLDLAALTGSAPDGASIASRLAEPPPNFFQRMSTDWAQVPVPVIAAIHGACFGGGLQLALGADIRIAAPDARLSVMEVRLGLIPDMGITRSLPRLVRLDVAKELTFSGRVLDGTEAHELGLLTRIAAEPLAAAHELAAQLATRSPDAVRAAKRLYDEAWPVAAVDSLALEAGLQSRLIGTPNQLAAVAAAVSRQPPEFVDR